MQNSSTLSAHIQYGAFKVDLFMFVYLYEGNVKMNTGSTDVAVTSSGQMSFHLSAYLLTGRVCMFYCCFVMQ